MPQFVASRLSWAKNNGLFASISIRPSDTVYLDLAWHAHGDPPFRPDELRVASALDEGARDTRNWGRRQDFIPLEPGFYLFEIQIWAEGYNTPVERTYHLHWPGPGQEDNIRLVEARDASRIRGQVVSPVSKVLFPDPIRNRWALLVGINRYIDPAFPPLKFCVNDVLALERVLKSLGYTVVTLHNDAAEERLLPTRENVEAELTRLCQVVGPDDLLLVHLACHGILVEGKPALITRETRAPTLAKKALPLTDVEKQMRASKARRLVLTLDACHTGVEMGRNLSDPQFIRNAYDLAEGFALIAASTAQQVAQEWSEKEHGVFSYYLLEGLSGKADRAGKHLVTVDDLKTHVLDGLRRWNVEHGGLLQEPTARTEGMGDIILADYRGYSETSTTETLKPASKPLPADELILDVPAIMGKSVAQIEGVLGKSIETLPIRVGNADELPDGGESRTYRLGQYAFYLFFDRNGMARGFQLTEGLSLDFAP